MNFETSRRNFLTLMAQFGVVASTKPSSLLRPWEQSPRREIVYDQSPEDLTQNSLIYFLTQQVLRDTTGRSISPTVYDSVRDQVVQQIYTISDKFLHPNISNIQFAVNTAQDALISSAQWRILHPEAALSTITTPEEQDEFQKFSQHVADGTARVLAGLDAWSETFWEDDLPYIDELQAEPVDAVNAAQTRVTIDTLQLYFKGQKESLSLTSAQQTYDTNLSLLEQSNQNPYHLVWNFETTPMFNADTLSENALENYNPLPDIDVSDSFRA